MRRRGRLILLMLAIGGLCACSTASDVSLSDVVATPLTEALKLSASGDASAYTISKGDDLTVRFYYNPQLDEDIRVRPDGKISLSLVGDLNATGETPDQLSDEISRVYSRYLEKPKAVVLVRRFANSRAFVGGEVQKPGIVDMQGTNVDVLQAIAVSGGVTDQAALNHVIVVRSLRNRPSPLVMELNLVGVLRGQDGEQNVALMPNDVVYVPKSGVASLNLALHQFIWNNLNMSTFSGVEAIKTVP